MGSFTDFLYEIEILAYKILLWILLLPKTLLKLIFEPNWAPGYIKKELNSESKAAFDSYMSPVVLFLLVTLIPAILIPYMPGTGITVYEPLPYLENDLRNIEFYVEGKFISSTERVFHKVWWEVSAVSDQSGKTVFNRYNIDNRSIINYVDESGNIVKNPKTEFAYAELHDDIDGAKSFSLSESGERVFSDDLIYSDKIRRLDSHAVYDYFYVVFDGKGEYKIQVTIENYDPDTGSLIETLTDTIYATVPEDAEDEVYFYSPAMVYADAETPPPATTEFNPATLQASLTSETTYLLALGMLSLPLLFSFGTKALGEDGLGETSLKESFYLQCYYFSPVAAAFWSFVYASSLYTIDINVIGILTPFLIFLLIILWFWGAETQSIMLERGVSKIKAWAILFALMFALVIGFILVIMIITDPDWIRRYSIAFYPVVGAGIFIAYIVKRRRERLLNKENAVKPEDA